MNMNRLRPTGVAKENLDVWLSGVIHDACRDAIEAGMPERDVHQLLKTIAKMHHPMGSMAPKAHVFMFSPSDCSGNCQICGQKQSHPLHEVA